MDPDLALKISDAGGEDWTNLLPFEAAIKPHNVHNPKFDPNKPYEVVKPKNGKFPWNKYPLVGLDIKLCDASVEWNTYSKEWRIYSTRVINDNSPRPLDMIFVGLGFISFAVALIALKKWVGWIFRQS